MNQNQQNEIKYKYDKIVVNEHHFNNIELSLRKIASGWLLISLGAIAYIVKGEYNVDEGGSKLLLDNPKLLITIISFMGTLGLFIIWILDQLVYHRLLNSVFLLGLQMEYQYNFLPPIRTLMVLYSKKRGMARYIRWYYQVPMLFFTLCSIGVSLWYLSTEIYPWINLGVMVSFLFSFINTGLIVLSFYLCKKREKYPEVAKGFCDSDFVKYLQDENFSETLQKSIYN